MLTLGFPRQRVLVAAVALLACVSTLSLWLRPMEGSSLHLSWHTGGPSAHEENTIVDPEPNGILLVTAYFPFQSKNSSEDHDEWMRQFLTNIRADVYMFCPPDVVDRARGMRAELSITFNTRYKTARDIEPLAKMSVPRQTFFEELHDKDPERELHNENLYAIWAAKPFFTAYAANATMSRYKYVFWMDMSTFRSQHAFRKWPSVNSVDMFWEAAAEQESTSPSDLVFIPVQWKPPMQMASWKELDGPLDIDFSIGSMFGGTPKAVMWFNQLYWTYWFYWLDLGYFVGKDQSVWNSIMYLYSERFVTVWANDPQTQPGKNSGQGPGECGGWWSYYVYWLAPFRERRETEAFFFNRAISEGTKSPLRCRRIRSLPLQSIFRRHLWTWMHPWWNPSRRTLKLIRPPGI